MLPIEDIERRAGEAGLDADSAGWRIVRAIAEGETACQAVSLLMRVGSIGEPAGTAERALERLVSDERVVCWSPANGAPPVATLTPGWAYELGLVLVEPAKDSLSPEPRWGRVDPDHYEAMSKREWREAWLAGDRNEKARREALARRKLARARKRAAKGRRPAPVDRKAG